jgi:hypothetical protein
MNKLTDVIEKTLNRKIARELLLEEDPNIDPFILEQIVGSIDNPWDAPIIYNLIKLAKESKLYEN